MSTRYENHQRAAELQNAAIHAHRVAEQRHDKQDHLTGAEHSRQDFEHSGESSQHERGRPEGLSVGHGVPAFGHEEIAARAYKLWEERGRPEGSAELDWFHAVKELRAHAIGR